MSRQVGGARVTVGRVEEEAAAAAGAAAAATQTAAVSVAARVGALGGSNERGQVRQENVLKIKELKNRKNN